MVGRGHVTDTEQTFLENLRCMERKIEQTSLQVGDAFKIVEKAYSMFEQAKSVKASRDLWKRKYYDLLNQKRKMESAELKKSRDNWKRKYQELREKIKKEGIEL